MNKNIQCALIYAVFLSFVTHLYCLHNEENSFVHVCADYLYPYSSFHKVESICKNMWSDLDLFLTHEPFEQLLEKAPVLCAEIEQLLTAVKSLSRNEKETESYLPEDILYLMRMIGVLANKYVLVCEKMKHYMPHAESKQHITLFHQMCEQLEVLRAARNEIALNSTSSEINQVF
ncbi:MAG: hypothetical protein BWY54_00254 [Candidatus Dependentiae bacterium ADurb.Bin331]|nr:MAG: hypothetical protein BWY54_00254 [Candidatus Dependentiae bacterium ADurb.Bin331]